MPVYEASLLSSSLSAFFFRSIISARVSSGLPLSNSTSHNPSYPCGCDCTCLSPTDARTVQNPNFSAVFVDCLSDPLNKTFPFLISLWRAPCSLKDNDSLILACQQRFTNQVTSLTFQRIPQRIIGRFDLHKRVIFISKQKANFSAFPTIHSALDAGSITSLNPSTPRNPDRSRHLFKLMDAVEYGLFQNLGRGAAYLLLFDHRDIGIGGLALKDHSPTPDRAPTTV